MSWTKAIALPVAGLAALATHDLLQRRHALLRNFPVVGRARYLLEKIGPELRQYIMTANDEERPFSRDQRRFIYASAKLENPYFGFGTDNDVEHDEGYAVVKHRTFAPVSPSTLQHSGEHDLMPCAKVLGAARQPRPARRVRQRRQHAGLDRDDRRRDRAPGRHQVGRRRPGLLGGAGRADGHHRPRSGLHHDRRRRGRHRCRSAELRRLRGAPLPARLPPGLSGVRQARSERSGRLRRSGKARLPDNAAVAFALGADMVYVAREAMMAIRCIRAQRCHDDHCPTGVATQNFWLTRGLDVPSKAERAANYLRAWRREMLKLAEACGVAHPGLLGPDDIEILLGNRSATSLREVAGYEAGWGLPSQSQRAEVEHLMSAASRGGSAPRSATAR